MARPTLISKRYKSRFRNAATRKIRCRSNRPIIAMTPSSVTNPRNSLSSISHHHHRHRQDQVLGMTRRTSISKLCTPSFRNAATRKIRGGSNQPIIATTPSSVTNPRNSPSSISNHHRQEDQAFGMTRPTMILKWCKALFISRGCGALLPHDQMLRLGSWTLHCRWWARRGSRRGLVLCLN